MNSVRLGSTLRSLFAQTFELACSRFNIVAGGLLTNQNIGVAPKVPERTMILQSD
jgi:hypothetical protein